MCNVKPCKCKLNVDYYDVLSLKRDCDQLDIKEAFKAFCEKHDIENNKDADFFSKFHLAAEAYEVLSHSQRRIIYDNFGINGLTDGIPEPYGWSEVFVYHGDPLKTYREFINAKNVCLIPQTSVESFSLKDKFCKGKNEIKKLYLSLEEIYYGGIKKIKIKKNILLNNDSKDVIIREKILNIPIKPGLPSGTEIVFPEEGDEAYHTIPGDIIFITADRPHPIFQRDGANLLMTHNVTLQEALLGKDITIYTIDERIIRTKITSIITPDYVKILPSQGLPLLENWRERGDLQISFKIEFPIYLNVSTKNYIKYVFQNIPEFNENRDCEYFN